MEGEMYRFDVGEKQILIARIGEQFYASDSICTHEEADLSLGILSGETVTCPLHQAKFDLASGTVLAGPDGSEPDSIPKLRIYQTKIEDGNIFIEV